MSAVDTDDLLEPSLTPGRGRRDSIYSTKTGFFAAFLGGVVASATVTAVNAHRLGRLVKDAWLIVLGIAAEAALLWWLLRLDGNEWLQSTIGRRGPGLASRSISLLYFGLAFLVHRPYYRSMQIAGVTPPSGWRVGLCAVLAGTAATVGLALLIGA